MVLGCLLHQSPLEREESPAAEQGVERRPGGRAQARLQEASGGGLRGVRRGVALRGGRKLDRRLPTHRRALWERGCGPSLLPAFSSVQLLSCV